MSTAVDIPYLPLPTNSRWQPLRAGLVDLFFYDYQEFEFRDGRLLLRGNNGTGKSKVLALMLPFLLDGHTTPSRVEPDGDRNKRMEWNLLLGKRYAERLGYTWLEFGRLNDIGEAEYFTIGCGMKAVSGRPLVTWFFTTGMRQAGEFSLVDAARRSLSRERLREVLGDRGQIYDQARRYRRAVDDALFQLGPARYESLVSLLLQLRQPQLSKRPDERALSQALSDALPPLDRNVLGDVAEAFRNLEAEKAELDGLGEAGKAVDEFQDYYRRYARIATRRRAGEVRRCHSRYEKVSAELSRTQRDQEALRKQEAQIGQEIADNEQALKTARVRVQTLRESPEMRNARELDRAESEVVERQRHADRLSDDRTQLRQDTERLQNRFEDAVTQKNDSERRVMSIATELANSASAAGIHREHEELVLPLALPEGGQTVAGIDEIESLFDAAHSRRTEQISHMHQRLDSLREAQAVQRDAQDRWQGVSDTLERLDERRGQAGAELESTAGALVDSFREFCRELQVLELADVHDVAASLEDWTENLDGANPSHEAVHTAFESAAHRLARERAGLDERHSERSGTLDAMLAERRQLQAGEIVQPPLSPTRDEAARQTRDGAPFWKLVDFRESVPADTRAAVEAALQSSGLLDAWVTPRGELLDTGQWDVVLTPDSPAPASLDSILEVSVDSCDDEARAVDSAIVNGLIRAIAWGESDHPAWIDDTGRWRLGPARGIWGKPAAEYVGHAAREAARRRRIEELDATIRDAGETLSRIEAEMDANATAEKQLTEERRGVPVDESLRDAHRVVAELQRRIIEQRDQVDAANRQLVAARSETEARAQACQTAGEDLKLPASEAGLEDVQRALQEYYTHGKGFWPTLCRHADLVDTVKTAQAEARHSAERTKAIEERCEAAATAAIAAKEKRDTLHETIGATVADIQRKLARAKTRVEDHESTTQKLQDTRLETGKKVAAAAANAKQFIEQLEEQRAARNQACAHLSQLSDLGLLDTAAPQLEDNATERSWSAESCVQLARSLEKALVSVDQSDNAWQNSQRHLHERINELQTALSRHGHEAGAEQHDDLTIIRVTFRSQQCDTEKLLGLLSDEIRERSELLDARERELLEDHLVNDLASHLQEIIQSTEEMVTRMNEELLKRPTSTGMKLRLQWRALKDGEEWAGQTAPDGLVEARRRLLRQSPELWSPDDRKAVGEFLKKRIDDMRASAIGSTLVEVLDNALDYRYWHRFVVERWRDGQWRAAYGPASGGERVLVVTVPLFAAASSHYKSAGANAPRLVMLDEAFAGVDDDSRAKCLGLLAQFDMDVVMTSEREWGCYAEVPGLAIAQLTRHEDIDAVHVSAWTWDGRRRRRASRALPDLEAAARGNAG